ncbi:unnamed protein product [Caenorhabditis bovis]|uniref:Mic1 domain-containing protein n=1 Tax=Caenorhabditis bovis TaxID=2654633 RepID=A0A8S1E9M1_9PELO|nr:unnamed protein product [Caenorhabditis bovis]
MNDGNITRNFFDMTSQRICTMRNNGVLGLTSKRFNDDKIMNVRTRDRGEPSSVKFSSDGRLCLMQRTTTAVDIIFLEKTENSLCLEITVTAKSKEPLLAVEWVTNSQILIVTNRSAELVYINEEKKTSKVLKSTNVNASWAIYYAPSQLLLIANGVGCANIQPLVVAHSNFTRLKSFEVEFNASNTKENLLEKDVTVATIYGKVYAMVLRYSVRNASTVDLVMYELPSDTTSAAVFKYSLVLGFTGGCGIHVIDNLVIVHHQTTAKSYIFDVAINSFRVNQSPLVITSIVANPQHQPPPPLYTGHWFTFLPNIVIDSNGGVMYGIKLKNENCMLEIAEKNIMLEYLARRRDANKLLISSFLSCLKARALSLRQIRKIFNLLSSNISENNSDDSAPKPVFSCPKFEKMHISQQEVQSCVLIPLRDDVSLNMSYVANVMLQYLRSLYDNNVPVEAYFIELVVETLAEAGEMSKLHQIVTYRVVNDSKPLAFLLLSYEARCSTLFQSGVDILARNKANDEIVEVMLEKKQIVDAFRFIDAMNLNDSLLPKIIEGADENCSVQTKYAIKEHMIEKRVKSTLLTKFDDLYEEENIEKAEDELSTFTLYEF